MNLESLEACKNEAGPTSLGCLPLETFALGAAYLEPRQLSLLSIAAALKNWSKPVGPAASRMACKEQISYEAEDDKLQEFLKNEDASNCCLAPSASSFRQLNGFSSSSHSSECPTSSVQWFLAIRREGSGRSVLQVQSTWEGLVQGRGRERCCQEGAGAPRYEPEAWAVRHGPSTGVVQGRQMLWGGQEGRTGPQEHGERRRCRAQLGGGGSSSSHMAVRGDGVENSCNGATKKEKKKKKGTLL